MGEFNLNLEKNMLDIPLKKNKKNTDLYSLILLFECHEKLFYNSFPSNYATKSEFTL